MNYTWLYLFAIAAAIGLYLRRQREVEQQHALDLRQAQAAGLAEPPSLHPVIDASRCIGSGSCVRACPEEALGIVAGKAVLTNGSACIGHGACLSACPVEAISLVFGSQHRGVEVPHTNPAHETSIPGVFIAGELGGVGLIRTAAEQGRQCIESIRRRVDSRHDLDVLIVGCGPAGISSGLAAAQYGLKYLIIEQESSLGGSVNHYPRHKIVTKVPLDLALIGTAKLGNASKRQLLELWQGILQMTQLRVSFSERFLGLEPLGDGFIVRTSRREYSSRSVLLAMGRRGTPRKLGVPGEEDPKVAYCLVDPKQYRGCCVLVVGGGDSALESAIELAKQPNTTVTLSYRGLAFSRAQERNRRRISRLQSEGLVRVLLNSNVSLIERHRATLTHPSGSIVLPNDFVIICAGGDMPTDLLRRIGIHVETKFGTR